MSAAPLSKLQKRIIAQAARKAWDALTVDLRREAIAEAAGDALNDPWLSENKAFTWWRHREQKKATGCNSLCAMNQRDYLPCLLHFQLVEGTHGKPTLDTVLPAAAAKTLAQQPGDEHRRARWKLSEALRQAGLDPAYAAKICRTQYKCPLSEASTKQVWRLFYTIRNRRKARNAKAA